MAKALVPEVVPPTELRRKATAARNSSAAGTRPSRESSRRRLAWTASTPAITASAPDNAYCSQCTCDPMSTSAQARRAAALKGAKARVADRRSRTAFTRTQSVVVDEVLTVLDE